MKLYIDPAKLFQLAEISGYKYTDCNIYRRYAFASKS